jgi:hypothetical protein
MDSLDKMTTLDLLFVYYQFVSLLLYVSRVRKSRFH